MRDGFITIREHIADMKMWFAIGFGAGMVFFSLVNLWLVYAGVSP